MTNGNTPWPTQPDTVDTLLLAFLSHAWSSTTSYDQPTPFAAHVWPLVTRSRWSTTSFSATCYGLASPRALSNDPALAVIILIDVVSSINDTASLNPCPPGSIDQSELLPVPILTHATPAMWSWSGVTLPTSAYLL